VPYTAPTAEERKRGTFVHCSECNLDWSAAFADRRSGLCLDHLRAYYRAQKKGEAPAATPAIDPVLRRETLTRQGDACPICMDNLGSDSDGARAPKKIADVDQHGNLRGFLCRTCAAIVRSADDDDALLRAAADYLKRTRKKS